LRIRVIYDHNHAVQLCVLNGSLDRHSHARCTFVVAGIFSLDKLDLDVNQVNDKVVQICNIIAILIYVIALLDISFLSILTTVHIAVIFS